MATPTARAIPRVPARLCLNPTDLGTAFPHGGTALGEIVDFEWRPHMRYQRVDAEEFGTVTEAFYTGQAGELVCVLRSFDADALSTVFVDTATGQNTGRTILRGRATNDTYRAGQDVADLTGAIYLSPDDPLAHGIYLYRALPLVQDAAAINYAIGTDAGILCAWLATPDADGNVMEIGPRADVETETGL